MYTFTFVCVQEVSYSDGIAVPSSSRTNWCSWDTLKLCSVLELFQYPYSVRRVIKAVAVLEGTLLCVGQVIWSPRLFLAFTTHRRSLECTSETK